ncbi:MAG TPA: hypothetical protein VFR67_12090 [Pilimelia sp.]|nr:hypothetical protein [Pilimelia sp.]
MRRTTRWISATAVLALAAASVHVIATPTPALAAPQFLYGINYPYGLAAVDYVYSDKGMWKQLENVEYLWNYYPEQATEQHLYDRDALVTYARDHNTTARDANGHLLFDRDHDGEVDIPNAGFAFHEHAGKGVNGEQRDFPFRNFWFDDNWLARYMAQAYGRPLPDGLSEQDDFIRWRPLRGDLKWTPYAGDAVDQLALNGLHYLFKEERATARAQWQRILDKSGLQFDFHTGFYYYPNITENYHLGLFKILTDQLLARGQLDGVKYRELVQHSTSLRAGIIETQQRDGGALAGWTSGKFPGTTLMNTESIAVNVLALSAVAKRNYGAGQQPLLYATENNFGSSDQGTLSATPGISRRGYLTYGPYHTYPVGNFTAQFVMRSFGPVGNVVHLDVYDAQANRILAQRDVTAANFGPNSDWGRFNLQFSVANAANRLEFRTWWLGTNSVEIAEIRVL